MPPWPHLAVPVHPKWIAFILKMTAFFIIIISVRACMHAYVPSQTLESIQKLQLVENAAVQAVICVCGEPCVISPAVLTALVTSCFQIQFKVLMLPFKP